MPLQSNKQFEDEEYIIQQVEQLSQCATGFDLFGCLKQIKAHFSYDFFRWSEILDPRILPLKTGLY